MSTFEALLQMILMMILLLLVHSVILLARTTSAPSPPPAAAIGPLFELLVMKFRKEPIFRRDQLDWNFHRHGVSMRATAPAPDALNITTVFDQYSMIVELSKWMVDEGYSARAYPHSAKHAGSDEEYSVVYLWVRLPEDGDVEV